ncbi:expressed unknown protein [Seminavis robusta]|uniref:Uncharacterized protein n=1 Tax=Seminavis robusta TaxID=568900 RepID=A0A9N8E1W8_9STRA|nr:expressed unknown protein [Seminavis robusta]|eukprot:Sro475_g150350.1 n/a (1690) ;mRNA; f:12354-17902
MGKIQDTDDKKKKRPRRGTNTSDGSTTGDVLELIREHQRGSTDEEIKAAAKTGQTPMAPGETTTRRRPPRKTRSTPVTAREAELMRTSTTARRRRRPTTSGRPSVRTSTSTATRSSTTSIAPRNGERQQRRIRPLNRTRTDPPQRPPKRTLSRNSRRTRRDSDDSGDLDAEVLYAIAQAQNSSSKDAPSSSRNDRDEKLQAKTRQFDAAKGETNKKSAAPKKTTGPLYPTIIPENDKGNLVAAEDLVPLYPSQRDAALKKEPRAVRPTTNNAVVGAARTKTDLNNNKPIGKRRLYPSVPDNESDNLSAADKIVPLPASKEKVAYKKQTQKATNPGAVGVGVATSKSVDRQTGPATTVADSESNNLRGSADSEQSGDEVDRFEDDDLLDEDEDEFDDEDEAEYDEEEDESGRPGAYSEAPGGHTTRNVAIRPSIINRGRSNTLHTEHSNSTLDFMEEDEASWDDEDSSMMEDDDEDNPPGGDYLVQATLVEDDSLRREPSRDSADMAPLIVAAQPASSSLENLLKSKRVLGCGLLALLIVAGCITVGVVCGTGNCSSASVDRDGPPQSPFIAVPSDPPKDPSTATVFPRNDTTTPPTADTSSPSSPPTAQSSSAPSAILDVLEGLNLPEYTRNALTNPSSPQAQAYDWLREDAATYGKERLLQRFALATLYYGTQGDNWNAKDGWLSHSESECSWWMGQPASRLQKTCDDSSNLKHLVLEQNELAGSLPPEVGLLSSLEFFDLSGNALSGELPVWDSQSGDTTLRTRVPATMIEYRLARNRFYSTIPTEIGLLTSLQSIDLQLNFLLGSIPPELENLSDLKFFSVSTNPELTGTMPSSLCSIENLHFECSNDLCGCQCEFCNSETESPTETQSPTEVESSLSFDWDFADFLALPQYTRDALQNRSSPQFRAHEWVKEDYNAVPYGAEELLQRFVLATLFYSTGGENWRENDGWMSHQVNECSWWMGSAGVMNDRWIPEEVCDQSRSFKMLGLTENGLVGTVPQEVSLLSSLEHIYLSGNQLTGPLPIWESQSSLPFLQTMYLSGNQLASTIPSEVRHLTSLQHLDLSSNKLSGQPPLEIAELSNLLEVILGENADLSGTIPEEACNVVLFDCSSKLCGCDCPCTPSVPMEPASEPASAPIASVDSLELPQYTRDALQNTASPQSKAYEWLKDDFDIAGIYDADRLLQRFALATLFYSAGGESWDHRGGWLSSDNECTWWMGSKSVGYWPAEVCDESSSYVIMVLIENGLVGTIPQEISLLSSLEQMHLEDNQLSGRVPVWESQQPILGALYLARNAFSSTIPTEIGLQSSLSFLDVSANQLTGAVPREIGNLRDPVEVNLLQNDGLYGTIPASLCGIPSLKVGCSDILCGCTCPPCVASSMDSMPSVSSPPSAGPVAPIPSLSNDSPQETSYECFGTKDDLDIALDSDYADTSGDIYNSYGPIENWCFKANVNNFTALFLNRRLTHDINAWDVSSVREMDYMFWNGEYTGSLSSWHVARVTSMSGLFWNTSSFTDDLSSWDVSKVKWMTQIFADNFAFVGDVSTWKTSNVFFMASAFAGGTFNSDISQWDVSSADSFNVLFAGNPAFNQDLSSWDVQRVTDFSLTFDGATAFNSDISGWDVSSGMDFFNMFSSAFEFNQNLCGWKINAEANVTEMFSMSSCESEAPPDLLADPKGPLCAECEAGNIFDNG